MFCFSLEKSFIGGYSLRRVFECILAVRCVCCGQADRHRGRRQVNGRSVRYMWRVPLRQDGHMPEAPRPMLAAWLMHGSVCTALGKSCVTIRPFSPPLPFPLILDSVEQCMASLMDCWDGDTTALDRNTEIRAGLFERCSILVGDSKRWFKHLPNGVCT